MRKPLEGGPCYYTVKLILAFFYLSLLAMSLLSQFKLDLICIS